MSEILNLNDSRVNGFGSKADNLSKIHSQGLNTPKGIVFSSKKLIHSNLEKTLSNFTYPLIIRTSSNVEDTVNHSLAGVFESIIVNKKSELADAINHIIKFAKSTEINRLLSNLKINIDSVETNIIIQEYISGISGGVLFTNPSGNSFEVEIGKNSTEVTDGKKNISSLIMPINGQLIQNDSLYKLLQENVQKISKLFNGKLDIEWVQDKSGHVYILQARPVIVPVSSNDVVNAEIARLTKLYTPHGLYDSSVLPDLKNPTTVTVSLLEKIYSLSGPFGNFKSSKKSSVMNVSDSLVVTIFGIPYLDTDKINTTYLLGSIKKYRNKNSKVELSFGVKGVFSAVLHPYESVKLIHRNFINILRLKSYIKYNETQHPTKKMTIEELCDYLLNDLCKEIFKTSWYLQFVYRQIKRKVNNPTDLINITQDYSIAPWVFKDSFNPLLHTWHLSYDENEIASPSMINNPVGINDVMKIYRTNKEKINSNITTKDVLSKVMSNWDKTLLENYINIYHQLQQRRTDLHDNYVKTIRLIHNELENLQSSMEITNIWYSTIDEILTNKIPNVAELSDRKTSLNILKKQFTNPVNSINSWKELITKSELTNFDNKINILSPGAFEGKAVSNVNNLSASKSVLITKSLSQEIIYNYKNISGVITERGSKLSHVAVFARELNLPIVRVDSIEQYEGKTLRVMQSLDQTKINII